MSIKTASLPNTGFTSSSPKKENIRWAVCGLLFLATTINYMDRSAFSLIEPLLHLHFMGWIPGLDAAHQTVYDINYGRILICFQIAYGIGFFFAGRIIDKLGTKTGYAVAVLIWAFASISHSLVTSVAGFCIARIFLGIGESGNFPAAIKATTEWFPPEERAFATGLFNSGTNASFFIAPILIAVVTAHFGWHAAFICTGSMGMIWLILWLIFPYNKLRCRATKAEADPVPDDLEGGVSYSVLLRQRGLYAFSIAKGLTDPIWWFYLFYLPKFLNDNYGLDLNHVKYPLIVIYTVASIGSVGGGWLSGFYMKRGHTANSSRKFALLVCSLAVLPIILVPYMHTLFPHNAWPAIGLFCLATAAAQGWSANLFATPTDIFPPTAISTVIGIGGTAGAGGGAVFIWIVSHFFSLHPMVIFTMVAFAYLISLAIFQLLVPHLEAGCILDLSTE